MRWNALISLVERQVGTYAQWRADSYLIQHGNNGEWGLKTNNGAVGAVLGVLGVVQSKLPTPRQLSRCYARGKRVLVRFLHLSCLSTKFSRSLFLLILGRYERSNRLPGSNTTVLYPSPFPIPNIRRLSATYSGRSFSSRPRLRHPGFSRVPIIIRLSNLRLSTRMSAPDHNNLLVRTAVLILPHLVRSRAGS